MVDVTSGKGLLVVLHELFSDLSVTDAVTNYNLKFHPKLS